MTIEQTRLARRRLALGIANVGFWVLTAAGGLLWLLNYGSSTISLGGDGLLLMVAVAAQAGFDFVGGVWLVPTPRPAVSRFVRGWVRGATAHTLALAGVGLLSYASLRLTGGDLPAIVLATAGLAFARRWLLRVVGDVPVFEATHDGGTTTLAAEVADPAFTGGTVIGWGSRAVSLLPASWPRTLPAAELAAEGHRRRWQLDDGQPGRAVLLVLGWNLVGAAAGSFAFRLSGRPAAAALLLHACWMTLWAFGGLLVLPSLSRGSVFAADRAALQAGHDPRAWITRFPGLVGEDGGGGNPVVQAIFYPVPAARRRLLHLDGPPVDGFTFGGLARNNLYYSWATCTLLGRAVHCNVGRPALWVFPPSA